MASARLIGFVTPFARFTTGSAGATVSSRNVNSAAIGCVFPAASVWTAETITSPSPSVFRSPDVRRTACDTPLAIIGLGVTVPAVPVSVTLMLAPASPVTRTTPAAWVASAAVAPSLTPVPRSIVGVAGMTVSSVNAIV